MWSATRRADKSIKPTKTFSVISDQIFHYVEAGSHYIVQGSLKLMVVVLEPPKCWGYRNVPPCMQVFLMCIDVFA